MMLQELSSQRGDAPIIITTELWLKSQMAQSVPTLTLLSQMIMIKMRPILTNRREGCLVKKMCHQTTQSGLSSTSFSTQSFRLITWSLASSSELGTHRWARSSSSFTEASQLLSCFWCIWAETQRDNWWTTWQSIIFHLLRSVYSKASSRNSFDIIRWHFSVSVWLEWFKSSHQSSLWCLLTWSSLKSWPT